MTVQDFFLPLNANLNISLALAAALIFGAIGWVAGRLGRYRTARAEVQDALERAARDVRLYSANGIGNAAGEFARRALAEAEYMILYRSVNNHHRDRPTGESRLRAPDQPRSHKYQQLQAREELRGLIKYMSGAGNDPDGTYVGPRSNAVHRRYSPNSQVLLTAAKRRRR